MLQRTWTMKGGYARTAPASRSMLGRTTDMSFKPYKRIVSFLCLLDMGHRDDHSAPARSCMQSDPNMSFALRSAS